MKRFLILFLTIVSFPVFSQTTSEIFDYKAITFYGLDFTAAKCIGISEFPGGKEMINDYFPAWNDLFMVGKKRIRIGKPYKKKDVEYDTLIYALNREMDPGELIIEGTYSLKKSQIEKLTEKFADTEKAGIGLVYIVESLNANADYASIWIAFFRNSDGALLLAEPIRSSGKGKFFGEYWENAILRVYMESALQYKTWYKLYH
jgi:hypothetical protein